MKPFGLMIILCSLLASCGSGISYNFDWDRDENMSKHTSFDWMAIPPSAPGGDAKQALQRNDLLDKRIKRAVESELRAKGYTLNSENPTFVILYHLGSEDKISVTDWGYRYGPGPWGYYGRDIDVRQYTQGSLILDFIDTETKTLFWRGEATKTINPNASQEDVDRTINEVAAGLLRDFPPE